MLGDLSGSGAGQVTENCATPHRRRCEAVARITVVTECHRRFTLARAVISRSLDPLSRKDIHPVVQSHMIDVDGVLVGAAVRLDTGYRFIATDMKLDDLDGSIWPTLADVQRLARRIYLRGRVTSPAQL